MLADTEDVGKMLLRIAQRHAQRIPRDMVSHARFMRERRASREFERRKEEDKLKSDAHAEHQKLHKAIRHDDQHPGAAGSGPKGSGRWKSWMPQAALRSVFNHLSGNVREVARSFDASHGTVVRLRGLVAEVATKHRIAHAREVGEDSQHVIVNLMWDETKMEMVVDGGGANVYNLLTQHGLMVWQREGERRREELVLPPRVVQAGDADCLHAAVVASTPFLHEAMTKAPKACLAISTDAAPSNLRLIRGMFVKMPESHLGIAVQCLHHQAGLSLRPTTEYLRLLCPLFCCVKRLHDGHLTQAIKAHIKKQTLAAELIWDTVTPPQQQHIQYAKALSDFASWTDEVGSERLPKHDRKKSEDIAALVAFFNGPWWSERPVHRCHGCCTTRGQAVKTGAGLLAQLISRRLPVLAQSRWLSLWPVVVSFTVVISVHRLFLRAYQAQSDDMRRSDGQDDDDDGHGSSEGEALGVPKNEEVVRRMARKRERKSLEFLAAPEVDVKFLVWICVAKQVMRVHYLLFSRGRELGAGAGTLFHVCCPSKSVALEVVCRLCAKAGDACFSEMWGAAQKRIDEDLKKWPTEVLTRACNSAVLAAGSLWRRFVWKFQGWPWRLCILVDQDSTAEERMEVARAFCQAELCCLDPWFGERLKRRVTCAEDLLEPSMLAFLEDAFATALPVTTHLEDSFAHMRKFVIKALRPPHVCQIASFHVCKELLRTWQAAKRLRGEPNGGRRKRARPRPLWTQSKRRRTGQTVRPTTWSIFVKQAFQAERFRSGQAGRGETFRSCMPQLRESFANLSRPEKERLSRAVRAERLHARVAADPLQAREDVATPPPTPCWNLGDADFPVAVAIMSREMESKDHLQVASAAWEKRVGAIVEPGSEPLPTVVVAKSCPDVLPCCRRSLADGVEARARLIGEGVRLMLLQDLTAETPLTPVLLRMSAAGAAAGSSGPTHVAVLCCSFLKRPFSAEFIELVVTGAGQPPQVAFEFVYRDTAKGKSPTFWGEAELSVHVATRLPVCVADITFETLSFNWLTMGLLQGTSSEVSCDLQGLKANAEVASRNKAALKALRRAVDPKVDVTTKTTTTATMRTKRATIRVGASASPKPKRERKRPKDGDEPQLKRPKAAEPKAAEVVVDKPQLKRPKAAEPKAAEPKAAEVVVDKAAEAAQCSEDDSDIDVSDVSDGDGNTNSSSEDMGDLDGRAEWQDAAAAEAKREADTLRRGDMPGPSEVCVKLASPSSVEVWLEGAERCLLGKLAYQTRPGSEYPSSVQVQCLGAKHRNCKVWKNVNKVPSQAALVAWLCAGRSFATKQEHCDVFAAIMAEHPPGSAGESLGPRILRP